MSTPSDLYNKVGEAIDAVSSGMMENLFHIDEALRSFTRDEITEVIEEAFGEGFKWTADAIHEKTALGTSATYHRALEMLSDLDSSDDWIYDVARLEHHEGVRLIAQLYGVPVVLVARDVADMRRLHIEQYLADRGRG